MRGWVPLRTGQRYAAQAARAGTVLDAAASQPAAEAPAPDDSRSAFADGGPNGIADDAGGISKGLKKAVVGFPWAGEPQRLTLCAIELAGRIGGIRDDMAYVVAVKGPLGLRKPGVFVCVAGCGGERRQRPPPVGSSGPCDGSARACAGRDVCVLSVCVCACVQTARKGRRWQRGPRERRAQACGGAYPHHHRRPVPLRSAPAAQPAGSASDVAAASGRRSQRAGTSGGQAGPLW